MKDQTLCVRHPEVSHDGFASLTVPTYRASTIVFDTAEAYASRGQRGPDGYSYGLHGTPTTKVLEAHLTALHKGHSSVILPSGQSAIAAIMLASLKPGETVLIPDTAYPPVTGLCKNLLSSLGFHHKVYDPMIGADIADLIDDSVRLVWLESPGSTTMEVQDFATIAEAARARGALVGSDNTWATPLLFKPLEHGADFAMEALTKYFAGHSDVLLGSVTVKDASLRMKLRDVMRMLGIGVSPDEVALVLRGMETMGIRIAHSGRIAEEFALRMADILPPGTVLHPALPNCPGHEFFKRDFMGASGVFSVLLPPEAEPHLPEALNALQVFRIGASWGGTNSLIAPMSIRGQRVHTPDHAGTILRLSIGVEDPDELWADIEQLCRTLLAEVRERASA